LEQQNSLDRRTE